MRGSRTMIAATGMAALVLLAACELLVHDRQQASSTAGGGGSGTAASSSGGTGGAACREGLECSGCPDLGSCYQCVYKAAGGAGQALYEAWVSCQCAGCYFSCGDSASNCTGTKVPAKPGPCDSTDTTHCGSCYQCVHALDTGPCAAEYNACYADMSCPNLILYISMTCNQPD